MNADALLRQVRHFCSFGALAQCSCPQCADGGVSYGAPHRQKLFNFHRASLTSWLGTVGHSLKLSILTIKDFHSGITSHFSVRPTYMELGHPVPNCLPVFVVLYSQFGARPIRVSIVDDYAVPMNTPRNPRPVGVVANLNSGEGPKRFYPAIITYAVPRVSHPYHASPPFTPILLTPTPRHRRLRRRSK